MEMSVCGVRCQARAVCLGFKLIEDTALNAPGWERGSGEYLSGQRGLPSLNDGATYLKNVQLLLAKAAQCWS